jgi:phosphohistidine phosphatase
MEVYLVQHGQSKPESEDPQRPLTDKGRAEVESVARYIDSLGIKVTLILHSSRLRAKQTAELLARYLAPAEGVLEHKGLGPLDDPEEAERLIQQAERPLMLVGHLPHLSRLASLLILGDTGKEVVRFSTGGVVCLGIGDDGWAISWALVPQLVRQMDKRSD